MNDITPKEAIANLNHIYGMVAPDIQRSLDVAIKCMEERPQGNCISREALKEAVEQGEGISWDSHGKDDLCVRKKYIDNAQAVDLWQMRQEATENALKKAEVLYARPKGEWIKKLEMRGCHVGDKAVYSYTCPFCEAVEFMAYPFCHCGADMRGDENVKKES